MLTPAQVCKKKTDPLDSRSYLPPSCFVEFFGNKLLAPRCSWTFVYPRSFHSLVPSNFDGSLEPAWPRGNSDQPQYIRHNKSLVLLKVMFKSSNYQKRSGLGYHRSLQTKTPPQSNARHPPRKEQARRRPVQPRFCLGFVSKTLLHEGGASWLKFVRLVCFLVLSPRVQK